MEKVYQYIIVINIITFIIYGLDKLFAIKNTRRISEFTLLLLSIIGGSIGGIIAMYLFHHKTRKIKFIIFNIIGIILLIILLVERGAL